VEEDKAEYDEWKIHRKNKKNEFLEKEEIALKEVENYTDKRKRGERQHDEVLLLLF
jgi:hypothetical protein